LNELPEPDRFNEAVAAHESGDLETAERLYRALLEEDADDPVVLELLGTLLVATGRAGEALPLLERSILLDASSPTAHLSQADALGATGDIPGAERALERCLALDRDLRPAMLRLGTILARQGRVDEARRLADRIESLESDAAELRVLEIEMALAGDDWPTVLEIAAGLPGGLGGDPSIVGSKVLAAAGLGRLEEAERLLEAMTPEFAATIETRLYLLLGSRGRFDDAAAWWLRRRETARTSALSVAIAELRISDPDRADRLQSAITTRRFGSAAPDVIAGMNAHAAGDHRVAAAHLGRAVELHADDPRLVATWASALNAIGKSSDAAAILESARAKHPGAVPLLVESARALLALHRHQESERLFLEAHARDPLAIGPMRGLAEVNLLDGRLEDCVAWCDRIGDLQRDEISELYASEALAGSIRPVEALSRLDRIPERGPALLRQSLYLSNFPDSIPEREVFGRHAEFGTSIAAADSARSEAERRDALRRVLAQSRRIRVGFLSPDFRRHSVWYFVEPLLASLDRGRFEAIGISDTALRDSVTERIRACCDGWIEVAGAGSESFRDLVRALDLDILVELTGHTAGSRLPELARRLAPVQMSWLGYPNTTGVGAIDFRLVDAWTDPQGSEHLATETLIRMPRCFLSHLKPPTCPEPQRSRRSGGPVFGSFNNLAKITDTTVRLWSRAMRAVPDSTLLIKSKAFRDPATVERLHERFRSEGVRSDRVVFRPWAAGSNEHMATYQEIDVALDTFPYNGTTTSCEALSMGVPVVSLFGDNHRSRVGASLLHAIGCPEWSAPDESGFVAAASEAASLRDRPRRDLLEGTPLRDPAGFAEDFANALDSAATDGMASIDRGC
jgi:predicted O-linked N-acetylglucosamine transferase (SPINDLY family)